MKYPGKYGTPWRQLRALTLEEKASLLSGHGFWRTKAIPEKGVKSLFMADGPHGVRKEDKLHTPAATAAPACPPPVFPAKAHWRARSARTWCNAWGGPWAKKLRPRAWAFCWGPG